MRRSEMQQKIMEIEKDVLRLRGELHFIRAAAKSAMRVARGEIKLTDAEIHRAIIARKDEPEFRGNLEKLIEASE